MPAIGPPYRILRTRVNPCRRRNEGRLTEQRRPITDQFVLDPEGNDIEGVHRGGD
jgi:hypothetical protein